MSTEAYLFGRFQGQWRGAYESGNLPPSMQSDNAKSKFHQAASQICVTPGDWKIYEEGVEFGYDFACWEHGLTEDLPDENPPPGVLRLHDQFLERERQEAEVALRRVLGEDLAERRRHARYLARQRKRCLQQLNEAYSKENV